jgi:hypothetical protein
MSIVKKLCTSLSLSLDRLQTAVLSEDAPRNLPGDGMGHDACMNSGKVELSAAC